MMMKLMRESKQTVSILLDRLLFCIVNMNMNEWRSAFNAIFILERLLPSAFVEDCREELIRFDTISDLFFLSGIIARCYSNKK